MIIRWASALLVLVLSGSFSALTNGSPQNEAQPYLFVGVYQVGEKGKRDCGDFQWQQQPAATREEAVAVKKTFLANDDHYNPSTEILEPGQAAVVYEYQRRSTGYNCNMRGAAIMTGSDHESVKRKLAQHVKDYPKNFLSEPQVVLKWDGGGLSKKVTRNYDGLEITYQAYSTSSGKTKVLAHMKNTRQDKKAIVFFRKDGVLTTTPVEVPAGSNFTGYSLGEVEHFGAALRWVAPDEDSPDYMRMLINQVKEQLMIQEGTTKEGKIKLGDDRITTGGGVRG